MKAVSEANLCHGSPKRKLSEKKRKKSIQLGVNEAFFIDFDSHPQQQPGATSNPLI